MARPLPTRPQTPPDYGERSPTVDGQARRLVSAFEELSVQDSRQEASGVLQSKPGPSRSPAGKVRWGELEEDDADLDFPLPPSVIIGPDENGIKKTIEYKHNEEGQRVKVTTTVRVDRVQRRKPNKRVQARRAWKKFGDAIHESSSLTTISAEQIFLERHGVPGTKKENARTSINSLGALEDIKGGGTLMVCRNCGKKGDHWTAKCPFKELGIFAPDGGTDKLPNPDTAIVTASASKQAYVPPGLRDRSSAGDSSRRRNEENSVRVTNLSEDTREGDLMDLFRPFGPISRVYVAVDQKTGVSRGFGFVNFVTKEDAQRAINKLNGYGYDNLILRVEWAGPRQS